MFCMHLLFFKYMFPSIFFPLCNSSRRLQCRMSEQLHIFLFAVNLVVFLCNQFVNPRSYGIVAVCLSVCRLSVIL